MTFTAETAHGPITGHEGGDPSGPAVLLLHGGPGLTDYMELLAPELDGWRAVYYQQRGHAPSATEGPFTVGQNVADAIAVLDAVGVDRAVLTGHSWGVHLASQIAIAYPERVAGLVLIDGPGPVGDGGVPEMARKLIDRVPASEGPVVAELLERLNSPGATDDDVVAWMKLLWPGYFGSPENVLPYPPGLRTSMVCNGTTMESLMEALADGFADALKSVAAPAVVLAGGGSPMPASQSEQIAALLPNSTFRVVPGAGHLVWYEAPGVVAEALATVRVI
jgi:pimeloyl-ACP methyl ester carboxylesterase